MKPASLITVLMLAATLPPSVGSAADNLYKAGKKKCGDPPGTSQPSPIAGDFYHLSAPRNIFVSADGGHVMTSDGYRVGVWALPNWTPLYGFHNPDQTMVYNSKVFGQGLGSSLELRQRKRIRNHGLSADGTINAFTFELADCTDIYRHGNYAGSLHDATVLGFFGNDLVLADRKELDVNGIRLLNTETGATTVISKNKEKMISSLHLSNGGRYVYMHRKSRPQAVLVDLQTKTVSYPENIMSDLARKHGHFAIYGDTVAATVRDPTVWSMASGSFQPASGLTMRPNGVSVDEGFRLNTPQGIQIFVHGDQAWLYDIESGALLTETPLQLNEGIYNNSHERVAPIKTDTWSLLFTGNFSSNKDGLGTVKPFWSTPSQTYIPAMHPPLEEIELQIAQQEAARNSAQSELSDVPWINGDWHLTSSWKAVNIGQRQFASGLGGQVYALGRRMGLILAVTATPASVDLVAIRSSGTQFDYQDLRSALPAHRRDYTGVENIRWNADGSVTGSVWYSDQSTLAFRMELGVLSNPWAKVIPGAYTPPKRMSWREYESLMSSGAECRRVMIYSGGEVRQDCVSEGYFNKYLRP